LRTSRDAWKPFKEALAAAGYPPFSDVTPLPDELNVRQRAIAEIVARVDGYGLDHYAIPKSAWCRRRWLGIDAGGVLEREVAFDDGARKRIPLWRALQIADRDDNVEAFVESLGLTVSERAELVVDCYLTLLLPRSCAPSPT
jgi:hypothetical protein